MDNAWVIYDPDTLKLLSVVWTEPDIPSVKIHKLLGNDFILGNEILTNWNVKNINGELKIEKTTSEKHLLPSFWNLSSEDEDTFDISLIIDENYVRISSNSNDRIPAFLFATIKNDPAWLIKTWNLYDFNIYKGVLILELENAKNYSYYLDKIQ